MSWLRKLTGFEEAGYHEVRDLLKVGDAPLRSHLSGRSFDIGTLELVSPQALRREEAPDRAAQLKIDFVQTDAPQLRRRREDAGAMCQVASQFNQPEMTGYEDRETGRRRL